VEGYAQGSNADQRYLLSRSRAQLVRDYVIARYGVDPKTIVVMPMGAEAEGSPDGKTWDGVGLALFVATSAVRG
jgi:hypothetical protein